jgi:hypothetical protein
MTAIVGVLNSQGIAIAADSAVTVTGNNGKKVYNRSNKIFTLSKFHPVGIAIYNNADFMGIPLETMIKMYRKKLKEKAYDTVEEYKTDFIEFLKSQLINVGTELKKNSFFSFCFESYTAIINNSVNTLKARSEELGASEQALRADIYNVVVSEELRKYAEMINGYQKANYINLSLNDYCSRYNEELNEIINYVQSEIQKTFDDCVLSDGHKSTLKNILFSLINIEFIFEKHCGLVFIGFGEMEIYPSSHLVLVGNAIADTPRVRIFEAIEIRPGKLDANILPYAQGDVTTTVLTGVDPNYKKEVKEAIKRAFDTSCEQISTIINNPTQTQQIKDAMDIVSNEFVQKLEQYQFNKITGPLLEILAHMGKEDMSELAESLVNITSLKRKFTSSDSSDESVGGPVDVAIITKGDGFIWMKRKHYFSTENNQGFMDKYYII